MAKWEYLAFARIAGSWKDDKFDGRPAQQKMSLSGNPLSRKMGETPKETTRVVGDTHAIILL